MRLQPYRQTSIQRRPFPKLAPRFYGHFLILRSVGKVAYELDLPESSRVHRVFHVSKLRPCHGQPPFKVSPLPMAMTSQCVILTPRQILGFRTIKGADGQHSQVLVHWDGTLETDANWESTKVIQEAYPNLDLEDKVPLERQGIDTNPKLGQETSEESELNHHKETQMDRPKREKKKPTWHRGYQL